MDKKKCLNFASQILERARLVKNQPATQRYSSADQIISLVNELRRELLKEDQQ